MAAAGASSTQITPEDFTRTLRYKIGLLMFIVGNLGIPVAAVLGFVGFSPAILGAIVVGAEIILWTSVVLLGKEGFKALIIKFKVFFKESYTAPVGRTRHRIGIALLLTKVVTTYIMMIYAWDAFTVATTEGPSAPVWGLSIEEQGSLVFDLFLIGELSFLVAIYVLGADWWGRFRRIFIWEGTEN